MINNNITVAFEEYKLTVLSTNSDLQFWNAFIKWSINEYQQKNTKPEVLYEAIFAAYNFINDSNRGFLKTHRKFLSIKTAELEYHRKELFIWIMNFAIIKIYNALEIFIIKSINYTYFPKLQNHVDNKKAVNEIINEMKNYLKANNIKCETRNNKYLIQFLKSKSTAFSKFINMKMSIDLNTNWEDFFELISILRNSVAHQKMQCSTDTENEINSKAKDIFQRQFSLLKDDMGYLNIQPIEEKFSDFIMHINSFALNTVKHISMQPDLDFLKMN